MEINIQSVRVAEASDNTRWRQPMRLVLVEADENVDDESMDGENGYAMQKSAFDQALAAFKEQGYKMRRTGGTIFIADKKKAGHGIYADTIGSKGKVHLNWSDMPDMGDEHFDSHSAASARWVSEFVEAIADNFPRLKLARFKTGSVELELTVPNQSERYARIKSLIDTYVDDGFVVKAGLDANGIKAWTVQQPGLPNKLVISRHPSAIQYTAFPLGKAPFPMTNARLVSNVSVSNASQYPWADAAVKAMKKALPAFNANEFFDEGYELRGPKMEDGEKLAIKLASAMKKAGFEVVRGNTGGDGDTYAIKIEGGHAVVIEPTAEVFEDGAFIVTPYSHATDLDWEGTPKALASAAPVIALHDYMSATQGK